MGGPRGERISHRGVYKESNERKRIVCGWKIQDIGGGDGVGEKRGNGGRKGNRDMRRDREVLQKHFKSPARAEEKLFNHHTLTSAALRH